MEKLAPIISKGSKSKILLNTYDIAGIKLNALFIPFHVIFFKTNIPLQKYNDRPK